MYPTFYQFQQGIGLHMWGLLLMVAFATAILTLNHRAKKVGIDPDALVPFYQIIIIMSLVGSRLLHFVFAEPAAFFSNPLVFFNPNEGGFAFYGGAIGGSAAGAAYLRWRRIPLWKLLDAAAPSIMLGLFFGRIGCFFAGCCHGRPTGLTETATLMSFQGGAVTAVDGFPFVAFNFLPGVGVGNVHNVPLFPTQGFESFGAFSIFVFLSWIWHQRRRFDGQVFASLLLIYPFLRGTIETFRGDSVRGTDYFGLLSTSQMVSIPVLLLGLSIFAVRFRKGVTPETPFVEPDDDDDEA